MLRSHNLLLGRAQVLFCFVLLTAILMPRSLPAQDNLLNLLPKIDGAIVWTDDFPSLLERLESLPSAAAEDWEAAWLPSFDDVSDDKLLKDIDFDRDRAGDQLMHLVSLWKALRYDDLFDGQLALVWVMEPAQEQPSDLELVLVARSSASNAEMEDFVATVRSLYGGEAILADDDSLGDEENERVIRTPFDADWFYEDGWFCWSGNDAIRIEVSKYLTGELVAEDTLAADRSFQNAFANLKSELLAVPSISIYVTETGLPFVAETFGSEFMITEQADRDSWRNAYLNELRGLGARVFVDDEDFNDELRAPIAMDAFLLMTQPRKGVLRSVGHEQKNRIRLDGPVMDLPLSRLSSFVLDGDELQEGVIDVTMRWDEYHERTGDAIPTREEYAEQGEIALMNHLKQFSETVYLNEDSTDIASDYPSMMISARILEREEFAEKLSAQSGEADRVPFRNLEPPFNQLDDIDGFAWVMSDRIFEEQIKQAEAQMQAVLQQIADLKEREGDHEQKEQELKARQAMLDQTEQMIEMQIQARKDMAGRPMFFMLEDWLIAGELNEDLHEPFIRGVGRRHRQIEELEETMADMSETFRNRGSICGVMAYWSDGLLLRDKERSSRAVYGESPYQLQELDDEIQLVPGRPEIRSPEDLRAEGMKELVCSQIDKLVLTVSNSDDGFRINGILSRPKPDEELEDEE